MSKLSSRSSKNPANLPQRPSIWHLAVRRLSVFVDMEDGSTVRPYLTLLVDLTNEGPINYDFGHDWPSADEILDLLWRTMFTPPRDTHQPPHRPSEIAFEQDDIFEALSGPLAEAGIGVRFSENDPLIESVIGAIEEELNVEDESPPSLLTVPGNSPDLVGELFQAAADFYRFEPWIYLSTEQPVKFNIPELGKSGYVQLMGNSAIEYGILLYWSWDELERSYLNVSDPRPTLPEDGLCALSYVTEDLMSPADIEALEKNNWPVADSEAYPALMIMFDDHVELPDSETTQAFIGLLKALPGFTEQLEPDFSGDYHPLDVQIRVVIKDRKLSVNLTYPAGVLRREAFPSMLPLDDDIEDELEDLDEEADLRSIDLARGEYLLEEDLDLDGGQIDGSSGGYRYPMEELDEIDEEPEETILDWEASSIAETNPDLIRAMKLIYEAWTDMSPVRRIQLAREALEISPDCADAYVLLAEELAVNIGQALKYFQKGVEAGERSLGAEFFQRYTGKFWDHVEARPYLLARAGLARTYWELGRRQEALNVCLDMVRLDASDHLAVRYGGMVIQIEMGLLDDAYRFSAGFEDKSTPWLYTTALLAYQVTGDSPEARERLKQALAVNPNVPDYLTGRKRLPIESTNLENVHPGHKSEALEYAHNYIQYWRQAPGAIDWLRKTSRLKEKPDQPKHGPTRRHTRRKR